jgi:hypothetical protein
MQSNNAYIAIQRLTSQKLAKSPVKHPADLVSWMGAIQAQDYAGAKWSIGLRLPGSTDTDVERAIIDKKIVRSWAMRGTLHFVSAEDIGWMIALLAPSITAGNKRRYQELELDEHTMARSNEVITKALQDKIQLDRPALVAILEKNGISTEGQRTPYLLQRAAMDRIICQGIMRSNNPTYLLLDKTMLKNRFPDRDEAAAELALRYFTSRAPASLQDFAWWSGLSRMGASCALDSIKSKLASDEIEGQTYWFPRAASTVKKGAASTYLLPGFDEYLLSYKDRSASMDVKRLKSLTPSNGMLPATIVVNGKVVGTWKRTFKKAKAIIASRSFTPLSSSGMRALISAAHRYGEFVEMAIETEPHE